ncbi:DUF1833 family protein [Nitrosovibrio sp. Nv6]|uniref:DUF1833 family protein n=1 Tax=Nitrosovibrio sp. Nv6 TaxID=1855340 RepID=UPI0008BB9B71|nr:DUF1833 family protein [Nitrosovibrio sp. Nv6]SEO64485.1 protein of unknown function [Nitrosovibrio sp. Nv6]
MPDPTLSDAWKEAAASAPAGEVMLHTLEFRHPNFIDEVGQPSSIRVVLGHVDLEAKLESTAPINPGEFVTFIAFGFEMTLPETRIASSPELIIAIDNVSVEIEENLALATASPYKVEVTYRAYLSTDLTGPQNIPPLTMTLAGASATDQRVEARATFGDPSNLKFPDKTYNTTDYAGLGR